MLFRKEQEVPTITVLEVNSITYPIGKKSESFETVLAQVGTVTLRRYTRYCYDGNLSSTVGVTVVSEGSGQALVDVRTSQEDTVGRTVAGLRDEILSRAVRKLFELKKYDSHGDSVFRDHPGLAAIDQQARAATIQALREALDAYDAAAEALADLAPKLEGTEPKFVTMTWSKQDRGWVHDSEGKCSTLNWGVGYVIPEGPKAGV